MEIGIIGGGAAAVALLDTLSRLDAAPGGLTVFEATPLLWRGRPYQPDLPAVRVNAPPESMSVRADDPRHYAGWLRDRADLAEHHDPGLDQPIVPRAVFGEYLEHTARAASTRLRHAGWRVNVVNARVTGYSRADAVLHTDQGGRHRVDRAVLCVGGGYPADHYGLSGAPGFVLEPYPLARTLTDIPADRHVAVIGSGLTAVDVAVGLAATGHTGPISLLSRSGMLPPVQQRPVPLQLRHLTRDRVLALAGELTLDRLVELIRAELRDLGQDFDSFVEEITETGHSADWLRRQLAAVDSPHLGRRLLTLAIRVAGPTAWRLLPERDRTLLRESWFRAFSGLSSPMVPGNARTLLRLLDSGQLRLVPGVTKIEPGQPGFHITDTRSRWRADHVVNAVNPAPFATPQQASALVSALLVDGRAELDQAGGLCAEPLTGRLTSAGVPDPTWHVLGNLAATSLPIATNPFGLAVASEGVARSLVAPRD
ncbi:FAD/NAD(P)-binding protein [Goodfellowiella coeruleoviolacea]|uniref:FAD/NAD(P)-binding protein n=1 Tax=Goodfellowiella coeruleoviolacea TaxID=334858 RepID=UPI0020A2F4FA|nr:FAD/NAD(P)-binding protein [Goodfellowiella coeruleoviolacea]